MPSIFAANAEGALSPSFDLRCLEPGQQHPDGWGIGYYPGDASYGSIIKETPSVAQASGPLPGWGPLESSTFIFHLRRASWGGLSDANTQPFKRAYARRAWMFAHSGNLGRRLELADDARFEPVGTSDSETLFCALMNRLASTGARSLGDVDPSQLAAWFEELGEAGDVTSVWSDGRDLIAYAGRGSESLFLTPLLPPLEQLALSNEALAVNFTVRGPLLRRCAVVSSSALSGGIASEPVNNGELLVVREGAVIHRTNTARNVVPLAPSTLRPVVKRPERMESKVLSVVHRTVYEYDQPVHRSEHLLRLTPVDDRRQNLLDHRLTLNVIHRGVEYDDVFGNRVRRVHIENSFNRLEFESRSLVEVLDTDPLASISTHERRTIPLVWMPWQRETLQPYLLPEELPETQLLELSDYAMSFVRRNDYDLIDTLLDINQTIFSGFRYVQNTTSLATTPFEVYRDRVGVCQDFANLFICMARLLGVPARYACGYIYVAPQNPTQVQSLASHAWVQVYLPEIGWLGLDPTNGVLTQTDHIRVAVGRNYGDATPTSGTIYHGGGTETLSVDVQVTPVAGVRTLAELG